MNEGYAQQAKDGEVPVIYGTTTLPYALLSQEMDDSLRLDTLAEMSKIVELYKIYEQGADFTIEKNSDYKPADLKFKTARSLIDKEARFLFSRKPDFVVNVKPEGNSQTAEAKAKDQSSVLQNLVDEVLRKNNISRKIMQAAKDCFIGKRVALMANFNDEGIGINFVPALEFVYEVEEANVDKLRMIAAFYTMREDKGKENQRIYKKKYWLEDDGMCWYSEGVYDGLGALIEETAPPTATLFDYVPARVIVNDGLTGDLRGVSEIGQLEDYESWYSKLSNADIDAERKGMNPITYAVDMAASTTKNLSRAAGSFWDLQSDQNLAENAKGSVGTLENSMSYSGALDITLKRLKKNMYQQLDMPEVEELQAQLSSGKALKSIYWGLIVRCDEKMLTWRPALEFICQCIIDGSILYPNSAKVYMDEQIPKCQLEVLVDNQYPLPEDELEEIQSDITKVNAQVMSKKRFIKKWEGLTDEEAMAELEQIALERQMLEDSYVDMATGILSDKPVPEVVVEPLVEEQEVEEEEQINTEEQEDGSENEENN